MDFLCVQFHSTIKHKKSIEEKQQLAHLFSINANEAIHQIAKHEGWKDGDPRKVALHAMVGGTTANLGGGQFSDGVYAAGLSEAMMPQFKKWSGKIKGPDGKEYVDPEHLQQIAFVFGYATNGLLEQNKQSGAYVSHMGAKHNWGYSPEEIKEKLNEAAEKIYEVGNQWGQSRIKGEEERTNAELHPEPLPASPQENGEALVSAEKSGNYDTEEYKEAADYTYNRDGDVDTSPTSDNYGFTLAKRGVQPTGITDDGTTYYIENGKTYMGPKAKDLDGIPSNERSNNYGLWLEENGYTPTGISNGHTYYRFYYDSQNPNKLLPYNPNHQPTKEQGYVDYIGYAVDQERPKTLLDSKISSVIENEGEQYKPFATLSMSSSSYDNRTNASLSLDNSFNKAIENLPKFRTFNKNNPEDLRDAGLKLAGYDDSRKEVYYEVKDDDGQIKRVYAGAPEQFKAFQENDLTSRNIENMINNAEITGKKFSDNLLNNTLIAKYAPKTKEMISDASGVLSSKGMNYALKPVRFGAYINNIITKINDNNIIYDDFDKYKTNKILFLKVGTDGYALRREYKTKSNEKHDFTPSQVNAGLGSNTDIATTNMYNYMVEPIKTIDIKTEDDREKDREYYINSQE